MAQETARKRLVLCLDGTWNSPNEVKARASGKKVAKPSNVLKICRSLLKADSDGVAQVCYYALGVGALERFPSVSNTLLSGVDSVLGGAFGAGFEGNVEDAVRFVAHNFNEGDEVFVFGFSRGASTARAVVNFLDWMDGVPRKSDDYYLPFLYRRYLETRGAEHFTKSCKQILSDGNTLEPLVPLRVRFLGVFDTVMALGGRLKATDKRTSTDQRNFHVQDVPPPIVDVARQALAVDERRWDFRPEVWRMPHPDTQQQDLAQRWFSGVHSNVGGGYLDDGLANVAFHWIRREAEAQGLAFDTKMANKWRDYRLDNGHESYTRMYRFLDRVRRRRNQGLRDLREIPKTANLSVDPSVFDRMNAHPRSGDMEADYRPPNVLAFLASFPNEQTYFDQVDWEGSLNPVIKDLIQRYRDGELSIDDD